MKDKLISRVYKFWVDYDKHCQTSNIVNEEYMLQQITHFINMATIDNTEILLDWCREVFDELRETYQIEALEEIEDKIYKDYPYYDELNNIWNLLNWHKDYLDNIMSEEELLRFIEEE